MTEFERIYRSHKEGREGRTVRRNIAQRLWDSQGFRYLLFGGLTVLVNLACFRLLTEYTPLGLDAGNALSILAALLFAYVTNTWLVFRSKASGLRGRGGEFLRFVLARLFTMALEFFGVHLLAEILGWNALFSKLLMQCAVIVLNYVFSRIIVYRKV